MYRCIQLARNGAGNVAPNPMVGALIRHENKIIAEGWHKKFGEAHAEVNCINEALASNNGTHELFSGSTLYASLEPCAHFGKTPPCSDLIIKHKIPKVVIGCRDPFDAVNGKGIEKLKAAGIDVQVGILEKECWNLNKRFMTFHTLKRPYVILKWAQSADGFIAGTNERVLISNEYSNRLVHQWRSEESSILVGTNTALKDDPQLTNRLWTGPSPIRLVIDMDLRLPMNLNLFDGSTRTIVFNKKREEERGNLTYYRLKEGPGIVKQLMDALYDLQIQSVIVEGGAQLLQSFIDEGIWDEVRRIKNDKLIIGGGIAAPSNFNGRKLSNQFISNDEIEIFQSL